MELNYIKCGDCVQLMESLPTECIDLTVTSPPYDNLRKYNGFDWDFEKTAEQLYRITKKGGVVVWVVSDSTIKGSESLTSFKQALYFKEIGFRVHDTMIYKKANYVPLTHNRCEQAFEYMFVFSKGKPKTFNPIMIPCKHAGKVERYGSGRRAQLDNKQGMRSPDKTTYRATKAEKIHPNVFEYTCGGARTGHPAAFPDRLAEDHVKMWSDAGDVVFDPFVGSGTTAKMAVLNNRNYIGFDISEEYCELSKKRIENALNEKE